VSPAPTPVIISAEVHSEIHQLYSTTAEQYTAHYTYTVFHTTYLKTDTKRIQLHVNHYCGLTIHFRKVGLMYRMAQMPLDPEV